ncbi:conjugal transfer protein TrbL family protein [Nocardia sp. NBC_01388]|uniref:conjugal transfer protein TrbL family protein n=1 Tax=Nocardia sp. NBC_01388 TaxID=2903596 RepID=UPI00324B0865
MNNAIDSFFRTLVDSALNPLMDLLSTTLLTTPDPSSLPQIGVLWNSSWQLVLAMYGLVVIAAGILLMLHETLQTRWGWREILPRLVGGFIAGAMSMVLATEAIRFANGLATAIAGDEVSTNTASSAFKSMLQVGGPTTSIPLFTVFLLQALAIVLVILFITYVIRVAVTVVLIVSAPLAMMCYALPATEGVARWWWRAFSACLAIQVVQSMVLITGLKVFLSPGGWWFFGPTKTGLTNVIVALALGWVLMKTPFWLMSALKISPGHGMVSSIVRGFIAYKTMGVLKGGGKTAAAAPRSKKGKPSGSPTPPPNPYANVRATRSGQLMLPLTGVKRVPPKAAPPTPIPHAASVPLAAPQGTQLMLPLPQFHGGVNLGPTPQLGRNGQYQLPIPVQRVPKPAAPPATAPVPRPLPGTRSPQPKQLSFDYTVPTTRDPYDGNRPTRSGQYPLPIEVRRVRPDPQPRTATPPPPRKSSPPPAPPPQVYGPPRPPFLRSAAVPPDGRQLHLPLPDLPVRRRNRRTPRSSK